MSALARGSPLHLPQATGTLRPSPVFLSGAYTCEPLHVPFQHSHNARVNTTNDSGVDSGVDSSCRRLLSCNSPSKVATPKTATNVRYVPTRWTFRPAPEVKRHAARENTSRCQQTLVVQLVLVAKAKSYGPPASPLNPGPCSTACIHRFERP